MQTIISQLFHNRLFILWFCFLNSVFTHAQTDNHCNLPYRIVHTMDLFHPSPIKINDDFSKTLFHQTLNDLDPGKIYFLQSDIEKLNRYELMLDDEIKNGTCDFITLLSKIYLQRIQLQDSLVSEAIKKPFDLNTNETVDFNPPHFTSNRKELTERTRKRLHYHVLMLLFENDYEGIIPEINAKLFLKEPALREQVAAATHKKLQHKITRCENGFVQETFLNALTGMYDPHSSYFTSTDNQDFKNSLSEEQLSFGFSVTENEQGALIISAVTPGGPAWKSNELHKNDVLLGMSDTKNNEYDFSLMNFEEISSLIKSLTNITLKIRTSEGEVKKVTLAKEKLKNQDNNVSGYVLDGNKKIGYIALPSFYTEWEEENNLGCANDVAKEILKLKQENIEGLILDLRYNGGGSLGEAISLAGIFIEEGPMVVFKMREGKPYVLKDPNRGTIYDGPLIVLVNGASASASEALAGVLQDYNRALIVGSPTYGKATAQIILPLIDSTVITSSKKSAAPEDFLKFTVEKIYRINGSTNQKRGLIPDIILPDWFMYSPYFEKNNPNCIPSDSIVKKVYYHPLPEINITAISSDSKLRTNNDTLFSQITAMKDRVTYFYEKETKLPLNAKDYRVKLVAEDQLLDKMWDLTERKSSAFSVKTNDYDRELLEMDEYLRAFLEEIEEHILYDPYIDETYKIMLKYLEQKP